MTTENQAWTDTLKHWAKHPWTLRPQAVAAAAATGIVITQYLTPVTLPNWTWLAAILPSSLACLNLFRLLNETDTYLRGRGDRPWHVTPNGGQFRELTMYAWPDWIQEHPKDRKKRDCEACGAESEKSFQLIIRFTNGGRHLQDFGMCRPCLESGDSRTARLVRELLENRRNGTKVKAAHAGTGG